jgi:hypothetical protein
MAVQLSQDQMFICQSSARKDLREQLVPVVEQPVPVQQEIPGRLVHLAIPGPPGLREPQVLQALLETLVRQEAPALLDLQEILATQGQADLQGTPVHRVRKVFKD